MDAMDIYRRLLNHFGKQDWWPVEHGFRPREFEIIAGAVLTQNTNWSNVRKALKRMERAGFLSPRAVAEAGSKQLEEAVRPSGFYRQKAERLKMLSQFIESFGSFGEFRKSVTREELLSLKGIGPETADSILLYALGRRVFVIDAYTRRIFSRLGFRQWDSYEEWRKFFENEVLEDTGLYMQYHALIVEHAKMFCRKKPLCSSCPLADACARKA